MEKENTTTPLTVDYDRKSDILTFNFTETPQPAIAEETSDDVWIRYAPHTRQIITIDILGFLTRLEDTFGPTLVYTERDDEDYLAGLLGLSAANE